MYGLMIANGDLSVRGDGNVTQATGAKRITQELSFWLMEPLGTDLIYERFGSTLQDLVGSPMVDEYMLEVREEVARVVQNYIEYQARQVREDENRGGGNWTRDDIIEGVRSIDVMAIADTLQVTIQLMLSSGRTIEVRQTSEG